MRLSQDPREVSWRAAAICALAAMMLSQTAAAQVGVWRRQVIDLPNATYSGNPFELEVSATFSHGGSQETLTLPGYYAGNDVWKVAFMPTRPGTWTYTTSSTDSDLDLQTGQVQAVDAGHPGMLVADPAYPRKWKYTDGGYAIPIGLRMDVFHEVATDAEFTAAADFLLNEVGGQYYEGTLRNEVFTDAATHQFNLPLWDQFERRLEILAARGLGFQLMVYSDDSAAPTWGGQSATEALVLRYIVARTAAFPTIWYNTGVDIVEYRNQADIDWFGATIRSLDPYGHPISSRYGGGSGSMVMSGQGWDSRGDRLALINDMTSYFNSSTVPVSMDDAWGENRPSHPAKNFMPEDIRRAFWKCLVAGGLGGLVRGSVYWFEINGIALDLESEQWLKLVNPFVQSRLGANFGLMVPRPDLVTNGYAIADPGHTNIVIMTIGVNDSWDTGNGGDVTVHLGGVATPQAASWFDPRTGSDTLFGTLTPGTNHILTPPSTDDWILYLATTTPATAPPAEPINLQVR